MQLYVVILRPNDDALALRMRPRLDALGSPMRIREGAWLLRTSLGPDQIAEKLLPVVEPNGVLLVLPAKGDITGYLTDRVWDALTDGK